MSGSWSFTCAVAITALIGTPGTAAAQSPCGNSVTVTLGDTLSGIASRCNTTVEHLIRSNSYISDPDMIRVGQILTIPGGDDRATGPSAEQPAVPVTPAGNLFLAPVSGPPGTDVRVLATRLPRNAEVEIGAGPPGSEYDVLQRARTTSRGNVDARVALPEHAANHEFFVFVISHRSRVVARSGAFDVSTTDRGETPDRGGSDQIEVTGTVTGRGVECPAIRDEEGKIYTLTGNLPELKEGDRVQVLGSVAEISICMQGTTINVTRIERR